MHLASTEALCPLPWAALRTSSPQNSGRGEHNSHKLQSAAPHYVFSETQYIFLKSCFYCMILVNFSRIYMVFFHNSSVFTFSHCIWGENLSISSICHSKSSIFLFQCYFRLYFSLLFAGIVPRTVLCNFNLLSAFRQKQCG